MTAAIATTGTMTAGATVTVGMTIEGTGEISKEDIATDWIEEEKMLAIVGSSTRTTPVTLGTVTATTVRDSAEDMRQAIVRTSDSSVTKERASLNRSKEAHRRSGRWAFSL